jgi:DNA replication protein DnaC
LRPEDLEASLLPPGATIGPPTRRPSTNPVTQLADAIPKPGEYPCAVCSTTVPLPGVCDACARKADEEEHHRTFAFARSTIPERFRWANLESPSLDQAVDPVAAREVRALFGAPLPVGVALLGPAGCGKTSLACAILRRLHDRAVYGCAQAILRRAQGAFFVSAPMLAEEIKITKYEKGKSELQRMALHAKVLVLDEVSSGGEDAWLIVQSRHDKNLPTIVTSWESPEELSNRFGGGFARRAMAKIITCKRQPTKAGNT